MKRAIFNNILTLLISLVWLINGLFAKVLDLIPRHQQIVARILGDSYAFIATKAIGTIEILMFIWVISRKFTRLNAVTQIVVVLIMNIMEFILAPELLLFGRLNIIIAFIFAGVVYFNEFKINPQKS